MLSEERAFAFVCALFEREWALERPAECVVQNLDAAYQVTSDLLAVFGYTFRIR